jgi:cytochrome oxidase assembly protein ShyY1
MKQIDKRKRTMKVFKIILITLVTLFAMFMALGFWEVSQDNSNKRPDRARIAQCWQAQQMKSNTPQMARAIAGRCETYEDEFRKEYRLNP